MDPVEFEGFEQDGEHGLGDDAYGEEEEAVEMEAVSVPDGAGCLELMYLASEAGDKPLCETRGRKSTDLQPLTRPVFASRTNNRPASEQQRTGHGHPSPESGDNRPPTRGRDHPYRGAQDPEQRRATDHLERLRRSNGTAPGRYPFNAGKLLPLHRKPFHHRDDTTKTTSLTPEASNLRHRLATEVSLRHGEYRMSDWLVEWGGIDPPAPATG